MKKLIVTITIIAAAFVNGMAQNKADSSKGFWVVESNVRNQKVNVVKFYDEHQRLMYQETVYGKIKVNDKKVQKAFNKLLSVLVNQKSYTADKELIALYLVKQ